MKKILYWTIAVLITLAASLYQRMTGPTYPKHLQIEMDGTKYQFNLPRSAGSNPIVPVLLQGAPKEMDAYLLWRHYPSNEYFNEIHLAPTNNGLVALLPTQPAAGKLQYYLNINGENYFGDEPLIMRFKGDVPAGILIPHILFMFAAMLFACYAGIMAIIKNQTFKKYTLITAIILFIGGFIFGPLVQHYAFGVYWSGLPFGTDLTDNKTLIALVAILIAIFTKKWRWNRIVTIIAVLVMFIVFSVPHSVRGSELNRDTGKIEVGK